MATDGDAVRYVRAFLLRAVIAAAAGGWLPGAASQESGQTLLLKAGFITKFPNFVTWPDAGASQDGDFPICVFGDTAIEAPLREVAAHGQVYGRPIRVRRVTAIPGLGECQLLFIPAVERTRLGNILGYTREKPILTVGDSEGFAEKGVLINLYVEDQRVRFEINREAVARSGLRLSFRLLETAGVIR